MTQADGYVQDILSCGQFIGEIYINAFVVGHKLDGKTEPIKRVGEMPERGRIQACTYAELVQTAQGRLFRLREKLTGRYEELTGEKLTELVVQQSLPDMKD